MINLNVNGDTIENVKTILFDKDGTLSDVHIYWSKIIEMRSWAIADFYKLPREEVFRIQALLGLIAQTKRLSPYGPVALMGRREIIWVVRKYLRKIDIVATALEVDTIFNQVNQDFIPFSRDYVHILPGVGDFVASLFHKHVALGVVTSDSVPNTENALKVMSLYPFFSTIIGLENGGGAKDTGVPAVTAMRELDADPETTIVIGDAPIDMRMAVTSNVKAGILVASGQMSMDMLKEHSKYLVTKMGDIKIC